MTRMFTNSHDATRRLCYLDGVLQIGCTLPFLFVFIRVIRGQKRFFRDQNSRWKK